MSATLKKQLKIIIPVLLSVIAAVVVFLIIINILPATADEKIYDVEHPEAISRLEINIEAAEIKIIAGDSFSVSSNLEHIEIGESEGSLIITERSHPAGNYNKAFLYLTVPTERSFSDVNICFGAGSLWADRISAETVELDYGAGEVEIDALYVSEKITIHDGTGSFKVNGGVLTNLSFDIGVGELDVRAMLLGHSDLHFGMGDAKITLLGHDDIYTLSISEHIGTILIDGMEFTHETVIGDGENRLDVNGGVGAVEIFFER